MLVGIEAGLGLSLLPVGMAYGRRIRPYAALGREPSMALSIYSWEDTGPVADLVAGMTAVLAERVGLPSR